MRLCQFLSERETHFNLNVTVRSKEQFLTMVGLPLIAVSKMGGYPWG